VLVDALKLRNVLFKHVDWQASLKKLSRKKRSASVWEPLKEDSKSVGREATMSFSNGSNSWRACPSVMLSALSRLFRSKVVLDSGGLTLGLFIASLATGLDGMLFSRQLLGVVR
jgi:hypothetical protein